MISTVTCNTMRPYLFDYIVLESNMGLFLEHTNIFLEPLSVAMWYIHLYGRGGHTVA